MLPIFDDIEDNINRASPFLLWVGGKKSLVNQVAKVMPKQFNNYYEPFIGGGAVFYALNNSLKNKVYLSDRNKELINSYKAVRDNVSELINLLKEHEANTNKEYFMEVREMTDGSDVVKAARFIYLNKACFKGIMRYNDEGKLKVSYGYKSGGKILPLDKIIMCSKALQKANLSVHSFENITPTDGDFVYLDPPYHETYDDYTKEGFNEDMQILVRDRCDEWRSQGASVIISNSNTPFIRDIWNNYNIIDVVSKRGVRRTGVSSHKVVEVLIDGTHK